MEFRTSSPAPKQEALDDRATTLSGWGHLVAEWTSVHGIVWYTRVGNKCAKFLILVFALCIVFGLPAFLIYSMVKHANDYQINSSVTWAKAKSIAYPNITVCHPRYFTNTNLKSELAIFIHERIYKLDLKCTQSTTSIST